jgi:ATP-dependent protease ClpP protease subunit
MPDYQIYLYGEIGDSWWDEEPLTAKAIAAQLEEIPLDSEIELRINSPGGDLGEGLAIYSLLKERAPYITARVDGYALSAASFILCAASKVVASDSSIFMIHNPHTISYGDANALRKTADVLDTHRNAVLGIYRDKTGKSDSDIITALDDETWFTGEEAVEFGLADELNNEAIAEPVKNSLPPWLKVSASAKKKLKAAGLMPKQSRVAAKANTLPKEKTTVPNEEEKTQKIDNEAQSTVEMKALLARVTDLEAQAKMQSEAIAAKDRELAELKRKDAVTALYTKVRNMADSLVKSNSPKLSTAEFEALGFTADADADIKNFLADDNAETALKQANFYVEMAKHRPPMLQTKLQTGDEPLPEKEPASPEQDEQYQADMARFEARLKRK